MSFHIFGHIESVEGKSEYASGLSCEFCFSDAGCASEEVASDGFSVIAKPGPCEFYGLSECGDGEFLSVDHSFEVSFEIFENRFVVFIEGGGRNSCHTRDGIFDIAHADEFSSFAFWE